MLDEIYPEVKKPCNSDNKIQCSADKPSECKPVIDYEQIA